VFTANGTPVVWRGVNPAFHAKTPSQVIVIAQFMPVYPVCQGQFHLLLVCLGPSGEERPLRNSMGDRP
jgi:hypothetical protein